jgi:hypothetical protein
MSLDTTDLSVLAYANGFTLWHYTSENDKFDDIMREGYFNQASNMLRTGDVIHITIQSGKGSGEARMAYVSGMQESSSLDDPGKITVSYMGASPAPIEPPKIELPTVPEFIKAMAFESGDIIFSSDGDAYYFMGYAANPIYPIKTYNGHSQSWTRRGWIDFENEGNPARCHLSSVQRNGVTVAEGQVYDD